MQEAWKSDPAKRLRTYRSIGYTRRELPPAAPTCDVKVAYDAESVQHFEAAV
jgi:hypothetical protein